MAVEALKLYQGSDWTTHRWPVAQAFDTLERLQDLCLCRADVKEGLFAEDPAELLNDIKDLCDDLAADLTAVEAELFPVLQSRMAHWWLTFEMRHYLNEIRQKAKQSSLSFSEVLFDGILARVKHIKNALRRLDQ